METTHNDALAEISKKYGDEITLIAGSVVLSDNPAHQLKYWRKKLDVKQADLARKMNITPSVLSDYEKGRRPSPGVNFIKRYLLALYGLAHPDIDLPQQQQTTTTAAETTPIPLADS